MKPERKDKGSNGRPGDLQKQELILNTETKSVLRWNRAYLHASRALCSVRAEYFGRRYNNWGWEQEGLLLI